jgi:adenylate cyclase
MEPLFLAVICGCNAGLLREALHEVYIPRIQRGDTCFAANVLGARGPLLSALVHFFEDGRWGSLVKTTIEEQSLTIEDKLFILMQAGLYLAATRGMGAPEAGICYECAEPLCHSLNQSRPLFNALAGQFRYTLMTDKLSRTIQITERLYSLAREQNDATLMLEAYANSTTAFYFLGEFETARQYARRGVNVWRLGGVQPAAEVYLTPVVSCLLYCAFCEWHFGEIATCHAPRDEAISIAKELKDMNSLAQALTFSAHLANFERNLAETDRFASELIELSTRHNFAWWLAQGEIYRGWARSALGNTAEGFLWIEKGIRDIRATATVLALPYFLGLKAEALYLANRTFKALEAIDEGKALAETFEQHVYSAELHRLCGVFLATTGAEAAQVEASFGEAIRIARELKSVSQEKCAQATNAEYCRQKASASGGRGIRLPLW